MGCRLRAPSTKGEIISQNSNVILDEDYDSDEHAPTPPTKFDEHYIPHDPPTHRTDAVTHSSPCLAHPLHLITLLHYPTPPKTFGSSMREHLSRCYIRRTDPSPNLDWCQPENEQGAFLPPTASAAFSVFVLHFTYNYYIQSNYRNTVGLLCTKDIHARQNTPNYTLYFISTSRHRTPPRTYTIAVFF